MANDLSKVMPKILARALITLRPQTIMPRLVNFDWSTEAAKKGETIDVPVPTAQSATDVTPSNTPPAPASVTTKHVQIALDNWKKSDFHLTDKEMAQIDANAHFVPMQMGEAVTAIASAINQSIFAEYKGVYGWVGTAGTTPFGSNVGVQSAIGIRQRLLEQRAPRTDRRLVLNFDAEAKALGLAELADFDKIGNGETKLEGEIGRRYGLTFHVDDDIPSHTAGTAVGSDVTANADEPIGETVISMIKATAGSVTLKKGDIITFPSDTQTYAVQADYTITDGAAVNVTIDPPLVKAIDGTPTPKTVTVKDTHVVNLGFHRDAFALAMRPLSMDGDGELGSRMMTMTDPLTGLSLRLEITRQYKQTVWELDALWGTKLVRPALAARLAG